MKIAAKILIWISFCLLPSFVEAACPLNFKNLSITSQTNNDKASIIQLQSILYINNLYTGPITGYYGNLTKAAINSFKEINGLNPNGIVDTETSQLICEQYAWCPFQSFLKKGDESPAIDIKLLQSFLRLLPNIYPEKLVTGYFGSKTENAVKRLQKQLNISQTGQTDADTQESFCNFFASLKNSDVPTPTSSTTNTTSIFQTLCLAIPSQAAVNQNVTFLSQILGGSSPYKYIWNNDSDNNSKTFQTKFPKTGTNSVSLKVIDSKGLISTSTCKVNIKSSSSSSDNTIDWDNFAMDDQNDIIESDIKVTVKDTSVYDKYLYNKKTWSTGWICQTHPSLPASCQYLVKGRDLENKLIYIWEDSNPFTKNKSSYNLTDGAMIYDTKEECTSFCTKDGDKNYIAYKSGPDTNSGWVCGLQNAKTCSYLNDLALDISIYNRLANKNVYTTQSICNSVCNTGSSSLIASSSTDKISQSEIEKLIKNPLQLDCEILPLEIVKNDPVKITIINMPFWARDTIDNMSNINLRGYWSGDILSQYLDLTKGEYTNQYNILDKSGKSFDEGGYQGAYKADYITVPKNIPPIYCGDGKCDYKESNSKSQLYCRMDCLGKNPNATTLDWLTKPINQISTLMFSNLYRIQPDGDISPIPNQYITKSYSNILTWLLPKFFNSGIYSIIDSMLTTWWRGQLQLQFMQSKEVWKDPYTLQLNLNKNFYTYNPNLQGGVLGGRILYWTFDKSGTYNLNYKLYYNLNGKEYLIGQTNNCSINVMDKPTAGKYMRVFLTFDVPTKSKVNCPKNFYLVDPKTEELKYVTPLDAKFENYVTKPSIYPYRDLDGKFLSFNWEYLFVKPIKNGGSFWNYVTTQHTNKSQSHGIGISVPLIGDHQYEYQIDWEKIDNLDKVDYLYLNKTAEQIEKLNINSNYYQPFSCYASGSYWKDSSNICGNYDKAAGIIFGYQHYRSDWSSPHWRSESYTQGNIYSGDGKGLIAIKEDPASNTVIKTTETYYRTLCVEEPIKLEPSIFNKRNFKYYPDLTLNSFKLGSIKYYTQAKRREVSIEVKNIGGENIKYHTAPYIVSCNRIDEEITKNYDKTQIQEILKNPHNYPHLPVGEMIGTFNLGALNFDANQTYILKSEFDCRKTDILYSASVLPKITTDTYIGCIIDPFDEIEESNENNNSLVIFKFNCDENQTSEDEEL